MQAIREIVPVKNHQIRLKLPSTFSATEVEIIVLPVTSPTRPKPTPEQLLTLLLNGPTLSKAEIKRIEEVRQFTKNMPKVIAAIKD